MENGPGSPGTAERRQWLIPWLLRAEEHRTTELQNQQARVATVLTANTFLLGLLATAALQRQYTSSVADAIRTAVAFAAIAMLFGLVALLPLNLPRRPLFLDRELLGERATLGSDEELLHDLVESLTPKKRWQDPLYTIWFRRVLLSIQLILLGIGTFEALIAVHRALS